MPFTPAHISIVLPLLRIRPQFVSATALIIGSVSPDFEYFLKMSLVDEHSHTLWGILYFNIPITILLAFLFHSVVKKNLIQNLPSFFQYRFNDLLLVDFKKYFAAHYWVFIISAAMGSFTHIFWDAFTHNDGYFAQRISYYQHVVIPFDGVRYPLFYGLQHISTWIGLIIVIVYVLLMKPQKHSEVSRPLLTYWFLFFLIYACVIFLRFIVDLKSLDLGHFVVSSISAILIALLVTGLIKFKRT